MTFSYACLVYLYGFATATYLPIHFDHVQGPQMLASMQIGRFLFIDAMHKFHCGIETVLLSEGIYESDYPPALLLPTFHTPIPLIEHSSLPGRSDTVQLLAIGPGSDLANIFGSVALVYTDAESGILLLNTTESDFVENFCFPDSIIRMERYDNPEASHLPRFSSILGRIPMISDEPTTIQFAPIEHILKFVYLTFVRIFYRFIVYGSIRNGTVGNCSITRRELPDLIIELTVNQMIILTPLDYTRLKPNGVDECELLIGQDLSIEILDYVVQMNPVLIPGFNTFATSGSSLTICEALHYRE
jgi:hypothetical protein